LPAGADQIERTVHHVTGDLSADAEGRCPLGDGVCRKEYAEEDSGGEKAAHSCLARAGVAIYRKYCA
jgi:hypothetical protein